MTLIGLTGGFCTGKTTAAGFFKELGAAVIDADKIVHELYGENNSVKRAVRKAFGKNVFKRGRIDRAKLGERAFASRKNLKRLCRIVHPQVIRAIKAKAKRSRKQFVVIDAPLLIEADLSKAVDHVVVVRSSFKKQIERGKRKGFDRKDILIRQAAQMPLREKVRRADFVIGNNRSKTYTKKAVKKVWKNISGGKNGEA